MGIIKILPEHIANRIAAGEVIERPSSIVKELVENALDAGAKEIHVTIRHGGKSLIRVADDGCGMGPDDAELAFQRHATSKIAEAADLAAIRSYGFRGEALPSIAAVSRTKLTTRADGAESGVEISLEGGRLVHAKEAACRKGTIVEVRDLFFNTPARRKFLKSDTTEMGHVSDMVANIALSRLDVHFTFKAQDRILFDLVPTAQAKGRAAEILGSETAKHLLAIRGEEKGIRIEGLIGKPSAARANRAGQTFFVNRRWVKAFPFSYALQAGYGGLLMHGQFPVAILFIEVDPERVDVNVHPTKQEVRISNEAEIKSLIRSLASARLAGEGDLSRDLQVPAGAFSKNREDAASKIFSRPAGGFLGSESKQIMEQMRLPAGIPALYPETPAPLAEAISLRGKLCITKVLGQIHNTFIAAETEEGFMVVDQHAAHERVMFEVLLNGFRSGKPAVQRLLMEEILEVSAQQKDLLRAALALFQKLGFEIEEFGEKTFVIRAAPSILEGENPAHLLKTFLEEKEDGKLKTSLENHQEEVAALIACKRKSVRAHDALTPLQIRELLERLSECQNPFSCPHGRPTVLKYRFLDLEKQFKRK